MAQSLLQNNNPLSQDVEKRALAALQTRLAAGNDLTAEEVEKLSKLSKSLFPHDFSISEETQETFRVLCSFSRCELKPSRSITSHRRFIGPLIVFFKRLSWPLIRFHLKEPFESMQYFNSRLIESHAKEVCRLELVKRQLTEQR
ncbi:MAG: hypothetical protein U0136_20460 [Bdellovibrionota bacterium]